MDDMYWSIERCGWAPCRGGHQAVLTPWHAEEDPPVVLPDVPQQRVDEPALAET
jgi:hypothetical protein